MTAVASSAPVLQTLAGSIRDARDEPLIGGPVLIDLLRDVVPRCDALLVLGIPGASTMDVLYAAAHSTTVLARSYDDAAALQAQAPPGTRIVAGSLAAFAREHPAQFDAVVAIDGLDRVGVEDAGATDWAQSLHLARTLVRDGGTLLVGARNLSSLDALLSVTPAARGADRELRLAAPDPTRPTSVVALDAALHDEGFAVTSVHCGFGNPLDVRTLASVPALTAAGPGTLVTTAVQQALRDHLPHPRVISAASLVQRLTMSASLPQAACAWIVVVGGHGRSMYLRLAASSSAGTGATDDAVWLDGSAHGLITGGQHSRTLPTVLPQTAHVEQVLLDLVTRAQLSDFRHLASRLGSWVRESTGTLAGARVRFDDLYPVGDTFTVGLGSSTRASADADTSSAHLLEQAWRRFGDRLQSSSSDSPWPAAVTPDQLVALWLGMSGVDSPADLVEPALLEVASAQGADDGRSGEDDVRSVLERSAAAQEEVQILRAQLTAVAEVLAARDTALQVREARIRELRATVLKGHRDRDDAVADLARVRSGQTYRLARRATAVADLRDPRKIARLALGRADHAIRAFRRMR